MIGDSVAVHVPVSVDDAKSASPDIFWDDEKGHRVQLTLSDHDASSAVDVSSPFTFGLHLDAWRPRIGPLFQSEADFETFMKLPISDVDRNQLLVKLTNNRKSSKRPMPQLVR